MNSGVSKVSGSARRQPDKEYPRQCLAQRENQVGLHSRLRYITSGACGDRGRNVIFILAHGEEDDLRGSTHLGKPLHGLDSVHSWQPDIDDKKVRFGLLDRGGNLQSVGYGSDDVELLA